VWVPLDNWEAQSSFSEPVAPPGTEPDAAPLVCVSFNQTWLPFVIGSLMQLVQPAAWNASPSAVLTVLDQATLLLERFGTAEVCMPPVQFQLTESCLLQYSIDGGATFVTVPGWTDWATLCFTGPTGPAGPPGPPGGFTPGPPPNPVGSTTAQLACDIAGYLAQEVIQASIAQAVSAITAGSTVVIFAAELAGVVLGLGALSGLLAGAAYVLYEDIVAGTLSDYSTASTSGPLRSSLICAIYNAIAATGYVTSSNFAAVLTNIAAVAYTPSSVVSTIHDYVNALGATGLEQIQPTGALAVYDCTACGNWCFEWDNAGHAALDANFVPFTPPGTATYSGGVWHAANASPPTWNIYLQVAVDPAKTYTDASFVTTAGVTARSWDIRFYSGAVGSTVLASNAGNGDSGSWHGSVSGAQTLLIDMSTTVGTFVLNQITLRGTGACPAAFGGGISNCT